MRKLYENFHIFHFQKRIVSAETIRGNTVALFDIQSKPKSPIGQQFCSRISKIEQTRIGILDKNPESVGTLFRHTTMAEFCNSVSALPLLGHLILKQLSAKKVQSRFFNFGSKISKILEVQCMRDYPILNQNF